MLTVQYFPNACYETIWQAMRDFTDARDENTRDQLWIVEHQPVYTLGQNGKAEHILNPQNIPVVKTDRGGQVTYHGPGQLVVYVLLELKRYGLGVRQLVSLLETSVVAMLSDHQIKAQPRCDAPGVYVEDAKICSIGLRIRRGCSYHGLALNVDMDLSPFAGINPCGYEGMRMTQLKALGVETKPFALAPQLIVKLEQQLKVSD
jgi:lipoyl(octanoyl) transferase